MASGVYTHGLNKIIDGTYIIGTTTFKVMLVNATYVFAKTHTVVDDGGSTSSCLKQNEITATNYTRGFGGAGRKTATVTQAEQNASHRTVIKIANLTWTTLGGATNDTPVAAVLIKEGTSDTDSVPIAYLDFTGVLTSGTDFTLTFDATNGNIRLTGT